MIRRAYHKPYRSISTTAWERQQRLKEQEETKKHFAWLKRVEGFRAGKEPLLVIGSGSTETVRRLRFKLVADEEEGEKDLTFWLFENHRFKGKRAAWKLENATPEIRKALALVMQATRKHLRLAKEQAKKMEAEAEAKREADYWRDRAS